MSQSKKTCPHCGGDRFEVVTDATLRFCVTEFGNVDSVSVRDFGNGLRTYVPWCVKCSCNVDLKELVAPKEET